MTSITAAAIKSVRDQIHDLASATEGREAKATALCEVFGQGDGMFQQIVNERSEAMISMWIEAITGAKLAESHAGRMS
jgi:hypothetical protein